MYNNGILVLIKTNLNLDNSQISQCLAKGGQQVSPNLVKGLLASKREKAVHVKCENEILEAFLNGLIILRRGESDKKPPVSMTSPDVVNNVVLKKLKIALDLSNDDIVKLLSDVGTDVTKGRLTTYLRKYGHKHYKKVSDDFLLAFLRSIKAFK